jgi:two-component system sensor histidine kinase HydH
MAEMDRKYAQVRAELDDLQREVREIQEGNFSRQTAAAVGLGRYEYIVGGFIVLMVAAVTLYGHRLARKMQSTQRQLVRQERLAALGEVAATIAHGMRNPLASIRAAAEVGRADLTEGSALSETLDDIVAEVDRLASRIRTVIDFAHPLEPRLARGDLNGFISGFADGARKRLPEAVCMHVALDPAVPAMQFDRAHMQEVLEALVVNAVEAMDGNGQVTIGSTLERDADTGRSVILSVEDTGSGIEASRIGRIFDLFYTSKPSGTGIGLAMAKRLVEVHGGEIEVASQPGHRTTFSVRLPVPQPPTVTRV